MADPEIPLKSPLRRPSSAFTLVPSWWRHRQTEGYSGIPVDAAGGSSGRIRRDRRPKSGVLSGAVTGFKNRHGPRQVRATWERAPRVLGGPAWQFSRYLKAFHHVLVYDGIQEQRGPFLLMRAKEQKLPF
jgi:hypothetical protein